MIKKMLCAIMAAVMLMGMSACGETIAIPEEEYDALHDKYLLYGTILAFPWDHAEELRSEFFPTYYAYYYLHDGGIFEADEKAAMYMPQNDVETMVQSRFDVSTEFLRSGSDYRPNQEAYEFYGIGGGASVAVTGAEQRDEVLTIHYDIISAVDEVAARGTITIEVNGEDFQYRSNAMTWVE